MRPKKLTADRFVDMRTECMYRYVKSETEYFRPHSHDYYEIFIITSGKVLHTVNGQQTILTTRYLVFIRPEDVHDYECIDNESFSMLNITFTQNTANEIFNYLGNGFPSLKLMSSSLPPSVKLTRDEFSALNTKMNTISAIPFDNADKLKTAIRVLIFELFVKYFSDYTPKSIDIPAWLGEICLQMRENGGYIEGSEKFFSLSDKSREHVCRSMRKHFGMTVSEYINNLRLNHIANMLVNSNHSITDIIYDSGFNNISWASVQFKKRYGISMREYRKRPQ